MAGWLAEWLVLWQVTGLGDNGQYSHHSLCGYLCPQAIWFGIAGNNIKGHHHLQVVLVGSTRSAQKLQKYAHLIDMAKCIVWAMFFFLFLLTRPIVLFAFIANVFHLATLDWLTFLEHCLVVHSHPTNAIIAIITITIVVVINLNIVIITLKCLNTIVLWVKWEHF